jgi:antitoxin HicB
LAEANAIAHLASQVIVVGDHLRKSQSQGKVTFMAQVFRLPVIIEQDEDGIFIVECPVLQGCHSYGYTLEEALENIKDAIRLHIEARRQLGEPLPTNVQVREVEVIV